MASRLLIVTSNFLCCNPFRITLRLRKKKTFQQNSWISSPLLFPLSECISFLSVSSPNVGPNIYIPEKASVHFISTERLSVNANTLSSPTCTTEGTQIRWITHVCIKPFYFISFFPKFISRFIPLLTNCLYAFIRTLPTFSSN